MNRTKVQAKNIFSKTGMGIIVSPPILLIIWVFTLPFLKVFINSFKNSEGSLSFQNFSTAIDFYYKDIFYTLFISIAALAITMIIAIAAAAYIRLKNDRLVEFLFKIPLFVPFVVVGHAMRTFLAPHGTLNSFLSFLRIIDENNAPAIAFSSLGIIIALVWKNIAFALLLVMAPFKKVSDSYINAARNLGAGVFKQIKDILVPMCKSSIAVSGILIFTSMMASFSIPLMLGNGEGAKMIMVDLYHRITDMNDYGTANALGMFSFIFSLGAAYYYIKKVLADEKTTF
ncbi:ABC transporter permease [Clostridium sp. DJ247]|uniref:ABC transporter permease n=1 Tax=Clostridium sp. DJ247 TaxID=2726188 RepID=UPI00162A3351|nr:ABC transporter permease subunit [Clostridium sp. DJ247]MBC2581505.1 ABC transporter permease subunit [Clostridium sp. DJ247]